MAESLQLGPEFEVVVYLTVVDDPDRTVFVAHGLVACVQVNDGQSPMPQPDRTSYVPPLAIRTAMLDHVHHPLNEIRINRLLAVKI